MTSTIFLLYKAEMTSVRLVAVTPVTRSSLHESTWDFAYVELWSLARECMFKQVSKSPLLCTPSSLPFFLSSFSVA